MALIRIKASKALQIIGSVLLLVMAIIHGSGFYYVSEVIGQSNTEEFLKEVVPSLFAHASIHLLGLAAFGFLTLFIQQEIKKVLWLLSFLVTVDALLAFYLGAIVPGVLLLLSATCFFMTGLKKKVVASTS